MLGATRRRVISTLLLEYGLLGLVTAIVASIIGSVAAWAVVTEVMRFNFVFDLLDVVSAVVIAVAVTPILGFYGTWRALGQKAAPLLRND